MAPVAPDVLRLAGVPRVYVVDAHEEKVVQPAEIEFAAGGGHGEVRAKFVIRAQPDEVCLRRVGQPYSESR